MIKIITLCIFISISLFARLNPFEADPQMSITTKKLEPIKVKNVSSKDDGNRTVHLQSQETMNVAVKKEKIIIKEKIIKVKPTKEEIAAQCKIVEKPMIKILKPKKPIAKKFVPAVYKVLPFLTVDVNYKDLKLTSRTKYSIVTVHSLKDTNKVAFDFLGKVWFTSKYKKLLSPSFSEYKIGNHKEKEFFRVAIKLKHPLKDYTISIKNHTAHIKYNK